jgi:hemerythrin-like domain-containing protein
MHLTTNGVVITDAIKYVNGKMEHLNKQEKEILQDIKEEAEAEGLDTEQQTHNTVF